MTYEPLKSPPLVEAIFEARWAAKQDDASQVDPGTKLLPGRMQASAMDRYPFHEPLPSSQIPDEMAQGIVQHRFRSALGEWPLIQIGPGILSVNQTTEYSWDDFRKRILEAVGWWRDCYQGNPPAITGLVLRYIDATPFDSSETDIGDFLEEKMGVQARPPASLFEDGNVVARPAKFNLLWTFDTETPPGEATLRIVSGTHNDAPALLWQTWVQSGAEREGAEGLDEWLEAAHGITRTWFRSLISGDLEKMFRDG